MLTVENISLVKEKHILKNVSFELARGEILVLLGPSGAGKTSLLRCLNRLDSLDSGNVFLDGADTRALPVTELRRRIGLIFQAPALIPGTVKKNVCAGPRLAGKDISDEACRSLLSQVGLKSEYCGRNVEDRKSVV